MGYASDSEQCLNRLKLDLISLLVNFSFVFVWAQRTVNKYKLTPCALRTMINKAIRDGRPRPPRHQVGWDIVRRECACQISWWSVEKWRRYYILKFHGNTFRWPTTLTFDLKFWKYLSVTEYPYSMCMLSFMMIGWEMTEILHFEILRKHGQKHGQTHKQTWALQYLALPLWGAR